MTDTRDDTRHDRIAEVSIVWLDGPLTNRAERVPLSGLELGRRVELEPLGAAISQRHAALRRVGERVVLHDFESQNGTWVNGGRITAPVDVNDGDVVSLANVVRFRVSIRRISPVGDKTGEGITAAVPAASRKGAPAPRLAALPGPSPPVAPRAIGPPVGAPRLIGRTGDAANIDFPVTDLVRLGSSPGSDLPVKSRMVSRQHAQIVRDGTEYFIEDLGSRNGTYVNGQRVQRLRMRHLDVLTLAPDVDLIFLKSSVGSSPAVQPLPHDSPPLGFSPPPTRAAASPAGDTIAAARGAAVVPPLQGFQEPGPGETAPVSLEAARLPVFDRGTTFGADRKEDAPAMPQSGDSPAATPTEPSPGDRPIPSRVGPILGVQLEGSRTFRLNRGDFLLGRSREADVRLETAYNVGRRHARLRIDPDGVTLTDLGTANGTFINGQRVEGAAAVPDGCRLALATLEFSLTFLYEDQPPS
jgi:pSer/pThr/pTyr-binding forkhead associated (FHA) protein